MNAKPVRPNTVDQKSSQTGARNAISTSQTRFTMTKSMHDGVEVWCDCCSCEAEPYWVEAMEEYQQTNSDSKPG